MEISVTRSTALTLQLREIVFNGRLTAGRVTFSTTNLGMSTHKGIPCFLFVIKKCFLPILVRMASITITSSPLWRECMNIIFLVTTHARGILTEKMSITSTHWLLCAALCVTLGAFNAYVPAI